MTPAQVLDLGRMARYQWEASATHEELAAFALLYRKLTGRPYPRRYRVEGTKAGNSRLLSKLAATKTQMAIGGTVVEAVPSATKEARHGGKGSH